ncbi:unnamed protein product [Adineta ricciae]|uniref:Uncharacterized protein n=1 Tax=Adineta ricciae TaxID=249248 RepID=A0A816B1E9_ADIRI|nr:unnamed protein product [Adineta ricciae]CAF1604960.1 unnamed protein product [Adineta ricciae]
MLRLAHLLLFVSVTAAVTLPELNVIKQTTFKYSYSCQPPPLAYRDCALFLTDDSARQNEPELLYNGACGSKDYFEVHFAGSNFGVISDLGNVPLKEVTASKAFNFNNTVGEDNEFFATVPVVSEHTYAALIARDNIRALFVFRIENYQHNGPLTLSYAVKQYGINQSVQEAPGFSWNAPNH